MFENIINKQIAESLMNFIKISGFQKVKINDRVMVSFLKSGNYKIVRTLPAPTGAKKKIMVTFKDHTKPEPSKGLLKIYCKNTASPDLLDEALIFFEELPETTGKMTKTIGKTIYTMDRTKGHTEISIAPLLVGGNNE